MSSAFTTTASASTSAAATTGSIEAQQFMTAPTPAMTHISRAGSQPRLRDPLEDFFDAASSRTRDSRHDNRRQSLADVPPPYAAEAAITLPEYTLHAPEPVTLAMYLFKFGFLFPPFWFFGAIILLSPLREPPASSDSVPAWMPEKTEEERQKIIADIREVELKWARRCLYAFLTLVVLVTTTSITAWLLLRH